MKRILGIALKSLFVAAFCVVSFYAASAYYSTHHARITPKCEDILKEFSDSKAKTDIGIVQQMPFGITFVLVDEAKHASRELYFLKMEMVPPEAMQLVNLLNPKLCLPESLGVVFAIRTTQVVE